MDEAVRIIEERIEKRSSQLKKIEKMLESWNEGEDGEDANILVSRRAEWLKMAIESNEEANIKEEDRVRLTKAACVYLSREMMMDDYTINKTDAQRLVREFTDQIAALREFLSHVLKSPLAEGHKNLRARQANQPLPQPTMTTTQ